MFIKKKKRRRIKLITNFRTSIVVNAPVPDQESLLGATSEVESIQIHVEVFTKCLPLSPSHLSARCGDTRVAEGSGNKLANLMTR